MKLNSTNRKGVSAGKTNLTENKVNNSSNFKQTIENASKSGKDIKLKNEQNEVKF